MMADVNDDDKLSGVGPGFGGTMGMPNPENRINELEQTEKFMYALREIAEQSEDPESVRVAFIALTSTSKGRAYLDGNPIKL